MNLKVLTKIAHANPGCSNAHMAAAIVKGKRVLGVGLNKPKTHPMMVKYGKNIHALYLHAEIDAIKNALLNHTPTDLEGSTILIARATKDGRSAMAKPCIGCMKAIKDFGITKINWTTGD